MTEPTRDEVTEKNDENQESSSAGNQVKTWYPYITKTQFEKFLARLENKLPEQIDRDYVRAIIRTPSMIYRFLRGIEAMSLIDREQKTTERLARLVSQDLRRHTIADILRDLYADLLEKWQTSGESMSDDEMVTFFRTKTGMGRDSANKMKMFFKYLLAEANFGEPPADAQIPTRQQDEPPPPPPPQPKPQAQEPPPQPAAQEPPPQPAAQQAPPPPQPAAQEPPPQPAAQQAPPPPQPAETPQEKRPGRDSGRNGGRNGGRDSRSQSQRNVSQPRPQEQRPQEQRPQEQRPQEQRPLTEVQKAYLQTLQTIVRVNIDGDWDDDMIRSVFDRLERLFDRIKRG